MGNFWNTVVQCCSPSQRRGLFRRNAKRMRQTQRAWTTDASENDIEQPPVQTDGQRRRLNEGPVQTVHQAQQKNIFTLDLPGSNASAPEPNEQTKIEMITTPGTQMRKLGAPPSYETAMAMQQRQMQARQDGASGQFHSAPAKKDGRGIAHFAGVITQQPRQDSAGGQVRAMELQVPAHRGNGRAHSISGPVRHHVFIDSEGKCREML